MTVVKIETKTKNGKNIENVEIESMNTQQMAKFSSSVAKIVRMINRDNKLQNIFKAFQEAYKLEQVKAEEYYKEQSKAGKKPEEIEEYNIGGEAMINAGSQTWNELLEVLSNLLEEAPELIYTAVAHASGLKVEIVEQQTFDTFMDLLDAVVEENNIEGIVNRLKKSKDTYKKILPIFKKEQ